MATRRHHQKSRAGCQTCKQKKVKCDETRPACQYCTLRSLQCTYVAAAKPSSTVSSSGRQTTTSTPVSTPSNSDLPISTSITFAPSISTSHTSLHALSSSDSDARWSITDFELLHFYTASTSRELTTGPDRLHVWQYVVPRIAFSHDFLLHGILALAALHLSRVMPERKDSLSTIASAHYGVALPAFRSAIESITEENCDACVAFGTLVAIYEWASVEHPRNLFFPDIALSYENCTVGWVQILRSTGKIITCHYEKMINGPLKPVVILDGINEIESRMQAEPSNVGSAKFASLELLWDSTENQFTTADVDSLKEALRWLRIMYWAMTTLATRDSASKALAWAVMVPEQFIQLVTKRQPAALIILAHFSLLLNKVDDFWWIRGMSRKLLQEIHHTLDAEWTQWLDWPLQDLVLHEFKVQKD